MKKLVISVLAVMFCLSLSAATTVQVKLVGSNPTYSVSQLILLEDDTNPAISAGVDAFDASCMMTQSNENSTLIYGMLGGSEYSTVASPDLTGLRIGFKTNEIDQNYKLQFEGFSGTEFTIYDLVEHEVITVNGSTPDYAFSVSPSQVPQVAINNRFIVNFAPATQFACFRDKILEINDSPYAAGKIVIKKNGVDEITGSPFNGDANVDLTFLPNDGSRYVVQFYPTADMTGEPARTLVIVVPAAP